VIVSSRNVIVASGYNGPPAKFTSLGMRLVEACDGSGPGVFCLRGKFGPTAETLQSYADCPSIHAEQNALNFCDRSTREGGALYVTGAVCYTCAKNIANSGLRRVIIEDLTGDRSYREPEQSYELLRASDLSVRVVTT
jgi:deoxycytidylate deaminase